MNPNPNTFCRLHGERIKAWFEEQMSSGPGKDPINTAMQAFLDVDPVTGEQTVTDSPPGDLLRVYHRFVQDNERLPEWDQLSLDEIAKVRSTLRKFYLGEEQVEEREIERVFRLVQTKMEQGHISQAWNILSVFDYDRAIQLENEHNLYLEEMANRFSRSAPALSTTRREVARANLGAWDRDPHTLPGLLAGFSEETHIRFTTLTTDEQEEQAWARLWEETFGTREDARTSTGSFTILPHPLFVRKWRPLTEDTLEIALYHDLISEESARHYISALLQGLYFLVLITEPTSYEDFLITFHRWMRDTLGPETMAVMSRLHSRVTLSENTIREAVSWLMSTPPMSDLILAIAGLTRADIDAALVETIEDLTTAPDFRKIQPGTYSLGGLILDRALNLEFPGLDLETRLHRLF